MTRLAGFQRITIKIGSSLLVEHPEGLKTSWLKSICADIAWLKAEGKDVLVVSSGAIAMGRALLGLGKKTLKLEESQAAAACGQISLARAWSHALGEHDITAGQILLTLGDTENRRRYLNARTTIETLLKLGAVPVINENDTVATSEIRYGDNDRLASRVATMVSSDLLILLSDIDGLYSQPPTINPQAEFISDVPVITPEIEAMAGAAGTELSRGGMVTKIEAGRIATSAGAAMVITSGKQENPVSALASGGKATWFSPVGNPVTARKRWISGQMETVGNLTIDDGAHRALERGKSLLPAGIRKVEGKFSRGDIVNICRIDGTSIGHGIVAYDLEEARKILGCKSEKIAEILGYSGRSEMIHRDDMVLKHGTGNSQSTEISTA
ncbi:MAG: glutamate 5-kinase [Rhizobiaceae bacterium]